MKNRNVLIELYAGILIFTIFISFIFVVLGIIFGSTVWLFLPGGIIGGFGACYNAYHMRDSIDRALDLDAGKATAYMTKRSMIRMLINLAIMMVAVLIRWELFIGIAVGLFGLKIAAYLNPFVCKIMHHGDQTASEDEKNSDGGEASEDENNSGGGETSEDEKNSGGGEVANDEDDDDYFGNDFIFPTGMNGLRK